MHKWTYIIRKKICVMAAVNSYSSVAEFCWEKVNRLLITPIIQAKGFRYAEWIVGMFSLLDVDAK